MPQVIQRFAGHVAQYLGDGLLVYFGYPQAHDDDAQRAVHTGLGILEAMRALHAASNRTQACRLAVRLGIHTGLVVVGEWAGAVGRSAWPWGIRPIWRRDSRAWQRPRRW